MTLLEGHDDWLDNIIQSDYLDWIIEVWKLGWGKGNMVVVFK